MSRISTIEQLYVKRKSALEFNYDSLVAPPIMSIFTQQDIAELTRVATSLKYNADIDTKYELIDSIMVSRGFRRANAGTNRVVYNYLEDPTFVAKVAIDKVGMKDTPAEYKNQELLKPFCCKVFEVIPNGVLGFIERVNPISSIEEFASVGEDIFNLMVTKIIGKYVVADLSAQKFMNFGVRQNANGYTFGPVVIDFPYVYELDDKKLICANKINTPHGETICGGEIDYTDDLDSLVCAKCGKHYRARDLAKPESKLKTILACSEGESGIMARTRIIDRETGKVVMDSGRSSKTYVSKDQCRPFNNYMNRDIDHIEVGKTIYKKRVDKNKIKDRVYTDIAMDYHNKMEKLKEQELKTHKVISVNRSVSVEKYEEEQLQKQSETASTSRIIYTVEEPKVEPSIVHVNSFMSEEEFNDKQKEETNEEPEEVLDVKSEQNNEVEDNEEVNENSSSIDSSNDVINQNEQKEVSLHESETNVEESNEDVEEVDNIEKEDNKKDETLGTLDLEALAHMMNNNSLKGNNDFNNYEEQVEGNQIDTQLNNEEDNESETYESFEEYNKSKTKDYVKKQKFNDDEMSEY